MLNNSQERVHQRATENELADKTAERKHMTKIITAVAKCYFGETKDKKKEEEIWREEEKPKDCLQ